MDLTVRYLEALLSVDEQGSFTRAADALHMTQPGVSRAVAGLERRLGRKLVHRKADGASLTAAGREVAEHGHAVLGHLRMIESLAHRSDPPRLGVGAVASALVHLVPAALGRLRAELPALRVLAVRGDDDELYDWLTAGTIDLSVSTTCIPDAACTQTLVGEFVAVLPAQHQLAREERVELADLAAAGVVDPGGTCGPLLAEGFAEHGVTWQPNCTVREVSTMVAMVAGGITVGVVPAIAAPQLSAGAVVLHQPAPGAVVLRRLTPALHRRLFIHYEPTHQVAAKFATFLAETNGEVESAVLSESDSIMVPSRVGAGADVPQAIYR